MLDQNLLFSLVLSIINVVSFYFIRNDTDENKENKNQELLMLFGITFLSSFILRFIINNNNISGGSDKILTHNTRAPF